jgi:7-dehydrocholesterol reductase
MRSDELPVASSGPEAQPARSPQSGPIDSPTRKLVRTVLGPAVLLLLCPPAILVLWITVVHLDGSVARLATSEGLSALARHWPWPSWTGGAMLLGFVGWQALLLRFLPGRYADGPITPQGNSPRYRLNGVAAYLVTHAAFLGASAGLGWFSPGVLYDHFGSLLATCSVLALVLCLFLYFKGLRAPSSSDAGSTGNFLFDYYWGTELHPRIFGMSLKQLINCRVSMTGWTVLCVSFAAKQWELTGSVSSTMLIAVLLQFIYIFKFFIWERGYFASLDIMHDRFGFYICWGVLAWVPGVYTLSTLYLVSHPANWPAWLTGGLFGVGVLSIYANYAADAQRQRVRDTHGETKIWGRPPRLIRARYRTGDGVAHETLLLASGFWGVAAHFHYVFEIGLALAWTVVVGFHHVLPYFYVIFLTILLLDRAKRDDLRCAAKYKEHWVEYRKLVRWRVIPGLY